MRKWLLLGPMIIATLATYFYFSLGFYKSVEIEEIQNVQFTLLAQAHEGAYYKILPVIETVEKWAKDKGIPCKNTFGEYLDDPRAVDEARLRSYGGCVLEQAPKEITAPFELRHYSEARVARARFFGSPSIGPFKVYPRVREWLRERKLIDTGSTLEIYIPNESQFMTEFYFPIKNE